jgi:ABC-type lipoprotein release transport system permease subunit
LYETSTTDPLTFLLAAVTLAAISLCATLVPARRATTIDPARTLKSE